MLLRYLTITAALLLGMISTAVALNNFYPFFVRTPAPQQQPPPTSGAYVGPGDILSHQVWYGVRAYSAATRGQKLMNVCNNTPLAATTVPLGPGNGTKTVFSVPSTSQLPIQVGSVTITTTIGGKSYTSYDRYVGNTVVPGNAGPPAIAGPGTINYNTGAVSITWATAPDSGANVSLNYNYTPDQGCVDIFSDANTGDMVPATVGGITCPNILGTCTINTAYDLTQSTATTSPGINVTQASPGMRPQLMSKAIPILGMESRACMWYPDWLTTLVSSANATWGPAPLTMSAVINNTAPALARLGNNWTASPSYALRPSSGFPLLRFSTGVQYSNDNVSISAGTQSTSISAVDHYPHAIQAMFSANGTSSIIYVDGVPNTGLTTGTTIATTSPVELGAAGSVSTRFDGIICEAGFASGDQSTSNASINANQTAYYLTPPAVPTTYTKVFDWVVDFSSAPLGRFGWATEKATFNDPSITKWTNSNYAWTSNGTTSCTTSDGTTDGVGNACSLYSLPQINIVDDGPASVGGHGDHALELVYRHGSCGYLHNPSMTFSITNTSSDYDVIEVEYDMMFRDASTAPNGKNFDWHSMAKTGVYVGYHIPGFDMTTIQMMWFGMPNNTDPNQPTSEIWLNVGGDQISESDALNSYSGLFSRNVWYHFKNQVAISQNGWANVWRDTGPGTPFIIRHAVNHASPWRYCPSCSPEGGFGTGTGSWLGAFQAPTAALALNLYSIKDFRFEPHYGGQGVNVQYQENPPPYDGSPASIALYADCPYWESYLVYDNVHVRGYMR